MLRYVILLCFMTFALPAQSYADSGLGIIGGQVKLGHSDHPREGAYVLGSLDVAITPFHGAQFDLGYEDHTAGAIGRLSTVLYMTPREGHKYGLSFMIADKNNVSFTYGQVGAASVFRIAPGLDLSLSGGIGLARQSNLDWITIGTGLHWQAREDLQIYAQYDIARFDEANLDMTGHELTVGLRYNLDDGPVSFFVEAAHDRISGNPHFSGDTTIRAGVTVSFGNRGNNQPGLRVSDPMRQLLRRGLY